jgi:arylsulfatase A-like enzyme
MQEESIKMPFVISFQRDKTRNKEQILQSMLILPYLLDYAGVEFPKICRKSFRDNLISQLRENHQRVKDDYYV